MRQNGDKVNLYIRLLGRVKYKQSFVICCSHVTSTQQNTRVRIKENKTRNYLLSTCKTHLELLFLTVLALPNASRTGFDCTQIS